MFVLFFMKHTFKVTLLLIGLFLFAQVFGLFTMSRILNPVQDPLTGEVEIEYNNISSGQIQTFSEEEQEYSWLYLMIGVLIGTLIIFALIKFKMGFLFKYWFLFVVAYTIIIALSAYLPFFLALALGVMLGLLRVFKPNFFIHNITEMLIYTGLLIVLLDFLVLIPAIILLIVISIYDMIAVWKSKHMIKLAEFQNESKLFAGLCVPYSSKNIKMSFPKKSSFSIKNNTAKNKKEMGKDHKKKSVGHDKVSTAILGGGDIAFPLLFSSAVMKYLIESFKFVVLDAMLMTFIISITATISLSILFFKAKKGKFYPAMPFLTAGCFVGFGIIGLILYIL